MKKIITILISLSLLTSCRDRETTTIAPYDTTTYRSNLSTDTGTVVPKATTSAPKTKVIYRDKPVYKEKVVYQDRVVTTKRKGWSHSAKDAVIGGAGGAVLGAVISKKKGKGAVIGGVVGAAGGYILGRKKDKREGR